MGAKAVDQAKPTADSLGGQIDSGPGTEGHSDSAAKINEANRGARSSISVNAFVFCSYVIVSLVYFCKSSNYEQEIFGFGSDPLAYVWFLEWWPWAIIHGHNPFVSRLMWYPYGFNLTWAASVPALALVAFPITLFANAVAAFNLLTLLAPAISAWTAYLLARWLTNNTPAAWIGGYLFGFSSYELGHLLGHLQLEMIFLVPLLVLFSLRRLAEQMRRSRYIAAMAVALVIQVGISTEIFATACVFGAAAWAIFLPFVGAAKRQRMWLLAVDIVAATVIATFVASPFFYFVFRDVRQGLPSAADYPADLLNFVAPTSTVSFAGQFFGDLARRFPGNVAEQGAYLGIPLVLIIAVFFWRNLSRGCTPLLIVLVLLVVSQSRPDPMDRWGATALVATLDLGSKASANWRRSAHALYDVRISGRRAWLQPCGWQSQSAELCALAALRSPF